MIVPSKTKIDELLPIQSVINMLDYEHRIMIIEIKRINLEDNHKYDYTAVSYLEQQ